MIIWKVGDWKIRKWETEIRDMVKWVNWSIGNWYWKVGNWNIGKRETGIFEREKYEKWKMGKVNCNIGK